MSHSDRDKVLAALAEAGAAGLSRTAVHSQVFAGNSTAAHVGALLDGMVSEGVVTRGVQPPARGGKRPVEVVILNSYALDSDSGTGENVSEPPPGEGWVPKAKTLRQARRGIVPAVAEREGKAIRQKERKRREDSGSKAKRREPRVSDETRGATRLIGLAYASYVKQGVIGVQGDWMRLARNPARRPPHQWHTSLLHFLAEAHPSLDGRWHRKPKRTLTAVMEDCLQRPLRADELVRRRPGAGGSWSPDNILLYRVVSTLTNTVPDADPLPDQI